MTDDNIRANVRDELGLADSALKASEALLDLGLAPDAASRAYYAAFHAARAVLFIDGLESRSHRALRTLISRHFVARGRLPGSFAKDLAQLEALRVSSDYDAAFALTPDDLVPELERARELVRWARKLAVAGGLKLDE
jgi:uncharacterized protein